MTDALFGALLDKPIAYHRIFVDVAGSVPGAVFLSHMLFLHNHRNADPEGWVFEPLYQWEAITGLTRYQVESSRQKLADLGVLEWEKRGKNNLTCYRLSLTKLVTQLRAILVDKSTGDLFSHAQANALNELPLTQQGTEQLGLLDSPNPGLGKTTNLGLLDSTNRFASFSHLKRNKINNNYISTNNRESPLPEDGAERSPKKSIRQQKNNDPIPVELYSPTAQDQQYFIDSGHTDNFHIAFGEFVLHNMEANPNFHAVPAFWAKHWRGWVNNRGSLGFFPFPNTPVSTTHD